MSSEITINSNIASLQTQRRLGQNSSALSRVFERLSSGQRINRASDDAAGLAISDSLRADARVYTQGVRNLSDGASMLNIADGALSELTNIVTRIKELAEQSANGTLGFTQRKALDAEAQALSGEYLRIAKTTSFNGLNLFDGSVQGVRLQAGYGASGGVVSSMGGALGTGSFAAATNYTTGGPGNSVAVGDLNGDGISDAVVGDGGANLASVLLGNGDGTFKAKSDYATGPTSQQIALNDLNGDGIIDILSTNLGNNTVSALLGNGDGTFKAKVDTITFVTTYGATAGDVNGDGISDLIVGDYGGTSAGVYIGNGNGTFKARTAYTVGSQAISVTLGDLNGDGLQDIVTANYGSSSASVLIGNGDGTFKAKIDVTTTTSPWGVALGDLNGDGMLDMIAASYATGFASVFLGNGNGTFKAKSDFAITGQPQTVALADFNGDGFVDMVTNNTFSTSISVLLGNGDGSFKAKNDLTAPASSGAVATGDFNGDGVADILSSDLGGGSLSAYLGVTQDGVSPLLRFSLKTRQEALAAMPDLDRSLKRISAQRGYLGAFQSRVGSAINNVQITIENFTAAESQIRDTDVAQDAANLAKGQILQQAAASVLAQANQEPQIALLLLQGR